MIAGFHSKQKAGINILVVSFHRAHTCVACACDRETDRGREGTFPSNKGGIRDALVGRIARGLSIRAAVRINPETSIRRQRPSRMAVWGGGGGDQYRDTSE